MKHRIAQQIFSLSLALTFTAGSLAVSQTARPAWVGKWQINTELSDDSRARAREATANQGSIGLSVNVPGQDGSAKGVISSNESMGINYQGRIAGGMLNVFKVSETLEIAQTDTEVSIKADDGRVRTLRPDGQRTEPQTEASNNIESQTERTEAGFRIKTIVGGSTTLTETYELRKDSRQLLVTIRVDSPQNNKPLVIRRVYDAVSTN